MENKRLGLLVTGADAYGNNAEGLFNAFDLLPLQQLTDNGVGISDTGVLPVVLVCGILRAGR